MNTREDLDLRGELMHLLTAAVATIALAQSPGAQVQEPDLARVERVLEQTADQGVESVARGLAALGNDAVGALFEMLAGGRAARSEPALLLALERLPRRALRDLLAGLQHDLLDERTRGAALRVLAVIGGAEDLRLLIALATPGREQLVARTQRLAFARALESILERAPTGIVVLEDEYPSLHLSLVPATLRSIARSDTPATLRVLVGLLGAVPGTDVLILNEVARLGERTPKPVDGNLRARVVTLLDSSDRATLIEAVHAVAALECPAAVEALIALLEHQAVGVPEAALRALSEITGMRIDRDPRRWRLWHERELSWWNGEARGVLAALDSALPSEASAAILELAGHTLFRHEIAAALCTGLRRSETDMVRMTCAALGQLRSERAVPALIDLLASSTEQELAQAARRALVRITGRDLGDDPDAWRSAPESGASDMRH